MSEVRRVARGAGLAVAGALSVVLGLVLAERLVRPDVIQEVRTPYLVALVMLFVLPVLTYFAVRQDERTAIWSASLRRMARRRADAAFADSQPRENRHAGLRDNGPEAPLPIAPGERAVRHRAHERAHERANPIPVCHRPAPGPAAPSE